MKHIFYIANIRIPTEKAHGVQIMKTCEAFAKEGVRVTLVVPRRKTNIVADPHEYYRAEKNFSIARIPTIDLVPFGKIGFWIETLIFSEFAVWYIRWASWKENHASKIQKVIYSRDAWPLLNCALLGWKLFWEAHMGSEGVLTRKLLPRLHGLVTISEGLKNLYVGHGVAGEKILVAPDAVDMTQFDIVADPHAVRKLLGIPSTSNSEGSDNIDQKIVMYIGLLDEWKGYLTLLEASKLISDPNIKIVIVGGTEAQITTLKEKYPQVFFAGFKDYADLPRNQQAADLLVIPNSGKFMISKYYTSPLKLFAHMASGVPVLASDLPSIREIASENEVAFFTPDDPADLAAKITEMLTANGVAEGRVRAKKAKQTVSAYSWDNRAKEILHFIEHHV